MNHWNRKIAFGLAAAGLFAIVLPGCGCRKKNDVDAQNGAQVEVPSAPDRGEIAENFKHDGYFALGLDFEGTLEYDVIQYGLPAEKGQSNVEYLGIQMGYPTFRVVRTGGLSGLGVQTISVREDGIYLLSATLLPGYEGEALEFPAVLEVGYTWESSIELDGITINMTNKVEGMETIKVPAGEFEAYRIVSTSRTQAPDKTNEVSLKAWVVPNVGFIKMRSEAIPSTGDKQAFEMQLSRRIQADSGSEEGADSDAVGN